MIFWIEQILIPENSLHVGNKDGVYKQIVYKKTSAPATEAREIFNNVVDKFNSSQGIYVLQMMAQVGTKDKKAIAARAIIDNLHNTYTQNVDVIKTYINEVFELAEDFETNPDAKYKPKMVVAHFNFEWYTDGDYTVKAEELKNGFKRDPIDHMSEIKWSNEDLDIGSFSATFKAETVDECCHSINELLRKLQTSMSASWTHHYLVRDLYDFFDDAVNQCDKKRIAEQLPSPYYIYASMSGNYDGTEIQITIGE